MTSSEDSGSSRWSRQGMPTRPGDGSGRVLVVDDEEAIRRLSALALRRAGFEVDTAESVSEAATRLQQHPFDAVVSDLSMPGQGGLELLRLVRAHDLDVPVILMTGEVIAEGIETAGERDVLLDLGVDLLQGYLFAKPGLPFPTSRFDG